jgi:hypothetical protein
MVEVEVDVNADVDVDIYWYTYLYICKHTSSHILWDLTDKLSGNDNVNDDIKLMKNKR